MTRDVWHNALRPDVSGIAVDALLFHEAGSQLVHRYRVYKDLFPHPALRDGVIPRLLSGVGRAMAIVRLTHLRISTPSSGAPAGRVPMECFPLATAPVSQARRRVSFADEVTTLNEEEINMLNADESPEVPPVNEPLTLTEGMEEAAVVSKTGPTPLIMPVVDRIEYDSPEAEPVELQTITQESGVLPPPGFPPFLFPANDGGMTADAICARFGGLASLTFVQIGRESTDIPDETDVPEAGVSLRPSLDSSSEAIPMVGYSHMPLPSVDNSVMPELVWMPPVPRPAVRAVDREVAIPRWRLAREGQFLGERSAESIRSLGPVCAFRNTSYRVSDYAEPAGEYGLLLEPSAIR